MEEDFHRTFIQETAERVPCETETQRWPILTHVHKLIDVTNLSYVIYLT